MKGILFKPESIQAIVDLRKTQTRRLGGLKYINKNPDRWSEAKVISWRGWTFFSPQGNHLAKPLYEVGETVYIKEAWYCDPGGGLWYSLGNIGDYPDAESWKSPLFLPEQYARHFIVIESVRAERLQEITEEDAIAEGVDLTSVYVASWADREARSSFEGATSHIVAFKALWNSINKDYPFESNPWVFPYTFRLKEGHFAKNKY